MENDNHNNVNGINLAIPALNQIYYVNNDVLTYRKLKEYFQTILPNNEIRYFFNIIETLNLENDLPEQTYANYTNLLMERLRLTQGINELINMISNNDFQNTFSFIPDDLLRQFKINSNALYNLIIYNDNFLYLFLDEVIISKHLSIIGNPNNITFKYCILSELELNQTQIFNTNYLSIVCSYNISTLQYFHKNFNSWNVILNTYSYCKKEQLDTNGEEYKITNKIKEYFLYNKNNIYALSPYIINEDIHFISDNFFQLKAYYDMIFKYKTFDILNYKLITRVKPQIVLLFTNTLCSKETFLQQECYISNNLVLYRSFINIIDKLYLNGIFTHWLITNASNIEEYNLYSDLFSNKILQYAQIHKCKMVNNIKNFEHFLGPQKQENYLDSFRNLNDVRQTCEQFRMHLQLSISFEITLNEIRENQTLFADRLNDNGFNYPVIMKYRNQNDNEQIVLLFNEIGYQQYFNQVQGYLIENFRYHVEQFINHGGYVIKAHHCGQRNNFEFEPSIANINDNEENHYYECSKHNLYNNGNQRLNQQINVRELNNDFPMKQFLSNIMRLFENFSGMKLYCFKLLRNANIFYIKKCVLLPSIKSPQIRNNFSSELRQTILTQNQDIKMPYETNEDFL